MSLLALLKRYPNAMPNLLGGRGVQVVMAGSLYVLCAPYINTLVDIKLIEKFFQIKKRRTSPKAYS
jgi:hypothetical protein